MNIFLIRHGQTNLNKLGKYQSVADKELNEFGEQQAELLGARLKRYGIDKIYSSDLKRVIKTSKIINKYINTSIIVREELREIDMGQWDTLSIEERYISHKEYVERWAKHQEDLPYPGGECGEDVYKRASIVIDEILETGHENVVVATSGGTIAILLSSFLGLEQHKRFNLEIDNCSISIVKYHVNNKKAVVSCINDTAHLDSLKLK
jgi:broad specificity phosphatase PhoE